MLNVAITGVGGGVGQSIIRAARQSVVPLTLTGLDADPWAVGLYQCDVGGILPPVRDLEAYTAALEGIIRTHGIQVLLPGTDTELHALSTLRDRFAELGCTTIVSGTGFINVCRDKLYSYTALNRVGVPFVYTVSAMDFRAGYRSAAYPVLLKPKDGSASVGARALLSPEEVEKTDIGDQDIIQRYLIPKSWGVSTVQPDDVMKGGRLRQEDELSVQAVVTPAGDIISIFASINELRDGVPIRVCPTLDAEILAFSRTVFEAFVNMGHVGPCNFQARLTDDGIHIYELNARFTGITTVRAAMGWNEVEAAIRLFALGESSDSVAARLRYSEDLVCIRYITEHMLTKAAIEAHLQAKG